MSKHTPGPWSVGESRFRDLGAGSYDEVLINVGDATNRGNCLAVVCKGGPGAIYSVGDAVHANARLIAAAPELLAIVSKLALLREGLENGSSSAEHAATRLALDAVAVVAKATGGAA